MSGIKTEPGDKSWVARTNKAIGCLRREGGVQDIG